MTQLGYFRDKVEVDLFKEWNLGTAGLGEPRWVESACYSLYSHGLTLIYAWMDRWMDGSQG